jgi:transglutaminase-like putative cysteine protease
VSSQLRLSAYAALATTAAATSLRSVFASSGWVVPVVGAILIVSGSCALVRYSPLPSAFEPITAAIGVLLWVTVLDAHSKAHLGIVPGRLALRHLGHVARSGFTEIRTLPTPAPAHHGLVLLTVVGVSAVALVVDLLTVTLRRAALSGLPLLALFTVSAATGHHGVGLLPFIVGSIGYLWLLFADNREKVARWGAAVGTGSRARPASAWSTDSSSAAAPASLGRQVGAMAISLGVLVPFIIPGLHTGIDKHGTGGSGGSGGGSVVTFNPIVAVGSDLQTSTPVPVLSYRTSTSDPGYLRLTSLDVFNGTSFSASKLEAPSSASVSEQLPVTPPPGPVVNSSISVSTLFKLNWLPVAATAIGASVGDDWRYDPATATIFSARTTTQGLSYTARSVADDPTAAQLEAAGPPDKAVDADLTVPSDLTPAVAKLTHQITAHATSRYDAALDIQRFLAGGSRFTYDTSIPADNSPNALAHFLLRSKRGFCQQFATAMAVMARLSGIPSRVAVGFTRGVQQANGSWLVTTHDAHAWPELWFQGLGWLAFEPTPRADGQAVTPAYATGRTGAAGGANTQPTSKPTTSAVKDGGHGSSLPLGHRNGGGATFTAQQAASGSDEGLVIALVAILLVLALITPGAARSITRRRRLRRIGDPLHGSAAAWAELRDTAIDLRAPWDDGRTPRQLATALVGVLGADPATSDALRRLAQCEEQSRYAATPTASHADLRDDVAVVQSAARATRTGPQQAWARVMPRSTLLVARRGLSRFGDGVDWISRSFAPVRRLWATRPRLRSAAHART